MTLRPRVSIHAALACLALTVLAAVLAFVSDAAAIAPFNPQLSATYSSTDAGSHPDVATTFSIGLGPDGLLETPDDTNDYYFEGIVTFSPSSPQDSDIPDGAILGTQLSEETLGLINNPCVVQIPLLFTYMEATTDINNTVEPFPYGIFNDLGTIAGDTPPFDGVAEIKPPLAVTKYPSYLNAIFDPDWVDYGSDRIAGNADDTNGPQPPLKPRFRSVAAQSLDFAAGYWLVRQHLAFEPGTKLPNLPAFDPSLGYPVVTVLQMRSAAGSAAPPAVGVITDYCSPLRIDTLSFGVTRDNPDTPADEGGLNLRTLPDTGATIRIVSAMLSERDADNDGYENTMDPCPFHADTVWNPHIPRFPNQPPPGDSDVFVGNLLGDGIPDSCDPTPTELSHPPGGQPTDHDGDSFANSGDNCPLHYNPDQRDADVNEAGEITGDGIGDTCDTPGTDAGTDCIGANCAGDTPRSIPGPRTLAGNGPTVPDGSSITCVRTLTITVGGPGEATASECSGSLPPTPTPTPDPTPTPTPSPTPGPTPSPSPTPLPTGCVLDDNDFDNDGRNNRRDRDDDNDSVRDGRDKDDDNDGIKDRRDRDDDNDGIPDSEDDDDGKLHCPDDDDDD